MTYNNLAFNPPDLTDRLAEVYKQWRRDNGVWCRQELERILVDYPWSRDALEFYGRVVQATQHVYNPIAAVRLYEHTAEMGRVDPNYQDPVLDENTPRIHLMCQVLRSYYPNNPMARILDVGSAGGEFSYLLTQLFSWASVIACDISHLYLHDGKRRHPNHRLSFVRGIGDQLPFPAHTFDVAVVSGVLEHVLSPEAVLDEAERVCRPGGLILIQVPYGGMEFLTDLPYRFHIHSINPLNYSYRGDVFYSAYLDYTNQQYAPHTKEGHVGDWVYAYTTRRVA